MTNAEEFRRQPPPPLPSGPISIPSATETTLSNGLSVVVVEDRRLPLITYRLAFPSGDASDPKSLPGLSDMMAGLLTEGTESRTSREIADEVARLGATLTAGASSDYTTVAASALTRFNETILELMADITLNPSFPEHEIDLAKQNTKESLKQQRAQPSFLATEMVSRVMFGEHPYAVVSPTAESIDATTRDSMVQFHRAKFIPNNAVMIVAGDVHADEIVGLIEKLFGGWARGAAATDNFPAPPLRTARSAYLVDRPGSAQSNIVIANSGVTRTSPDYFPLLLMHTIYGATASSRLFMNLREEKGYTYGAYSNLDARRSAGTLRSSAEVRTPVTGDSLKEFFYELNRIRTEPVSAKEIKDAKSYLTGVFPIRLETLDGLIDQLVQIKMLNLPDDYLVTYRDHVQAVTIEDIQEVATKYVRPDEAAIIVVGDGANVLDQIKPFTEDIQTYNTSGKLKLPATGPVDPLQLSGRWSVDLETPLGQVIPATLTVMTMGEELVGRIESELGSADLPQINVSGNTITGSLSFDLDGQVMEGEISATVAGKRLEGSVVLVNLPSLLFRAEKLESN